MRVGVRVLLYHGHRVAVPSDRLVLVLLLVLLLMLLLMLMSLLLLLLLVLLLLVLLVLLVVVRGLPLPPHHGVHLLGGDVVCEHDLPSLEAVRAPGYCCRLRLKQRPICFTATVLMLKLRLSFLQLYMLFNLVHRLS